MDADRRVSRPQPGAAHTCRGESSQNNKLLRPCSTESTETNGRGSRLGTAPAPAQAASRQASPTGPRRRRCPSCPGRLKIVAGTGASPRVSPRMPRDWGAGKGRGRDERRGQRVAMGNMVYGVDGQPDGAAGGADRVSPFKAETRVRIPLGPPPVYTLERYPITHFPPRNA